MTGESHPVRRIAGGHGHDREAGEWGRSGLGVHPPVLGEDVVGHELQVRAGLSEPGKSAKEGEIYRLQIAVELEPPPLGEVALRKGPGHWRADSNASGTGFSCGHGACRWNRGGCKQTCKSKDRRTYLYTSLFRAKTSTFTCFPFTPRPSCSGAHH